MSDPRPITGVGVGDSQQFGVAGVANAAGSFAPDGFVSGRFGARTVIYFAGETGGAVNFSFDQPYLAPTTFNVPFVFGGALVASSVGAGDTSQFGFVEVVNTTKVISASGWTSSEASRPKVYFADANGATVDFVFVDSYTQQNPFNVPFYFGAGGVVAGVTLGDQLRLGTAKITSSWLVRPSSIDQEGYGKPRVGLGKAVDFIFTQSYDDKPSALNAPFYFGGALPVYVPGNAYTQFGRAQVVNSAKTLTPQGFASSVVGRPRTYFASVNGGNVNFVFMSPYFTPSTLNVPFYFYGLPIIYPYGYDHAEFGAPLVAYRIRSLTAFGFRPTGYGLPNVENDIEAAINLANRGIFSTARLGEPTLINLRQYITQLNRDYVIGRPETGALTEYGKPTVVKVVTQYINLDPDKGLDALTVGTQFISHQLRYIEQKNSYTGAVGTPAIGYYVRYLDVLSILSLQMGQPTVGREIELDLKDWSWESSRFGVPNIELANVYEVQGWDSLDFRNLGVRVSRSPQYAEVRQTFEFLLTGNATVYNSRQYVEQRYDNEYDSEGRRGFGKFTHVFNANRTVDLTGNGWISSRVYILTLVENTGRALEVTGIAPPDVPKPLQIAYRIRYFQMEGIDSLWVSPWLAIYNAAHQIKVDGADYLQMGRPIDVSSNLQTIKHHTPSDLEMGVPMVADRIRTLVQEPTRDLFAAGIDHRVSLWENYIEPPGIDQGGVGAVDVAGPFRKILEPRWIWQPQRFGDATVVNFFKELGPYGFDSFDQGRLRPIDNVKVELLRRTLTVLEPANIASAFGRTTIRDRTSVIERAGGFRSSIVSTFLRVRREGPEPPAAQYILLDSVPLTGNSVTPSCGIKPPDMASVLVQGMPQPSGWLSQAFGQPSVRTNVITVVEWPYPSSLFQFGKPVLNPAQFIDAPDPASAGTDFGVPQLSPYTVWARLDTPPQAKANHPGYDFAYQGLVALTVPSPRVALAIRTVVQTHQYSVAAGGWVGEPKVELKIRRVEVAGIRPPPLGIPTLPYTLELLQIGHDSLAMGTEHAVENALKSWTRTISASGTLMQQFGQTFVENFHRPVFPEGFIATQWGNNSPMVYHKPRGPRPTGFVATLWGDAMVAYRIRHVYPEGHDSFTTGRTLGQFYDRMRVINKTNPVRPSGYDSSEFGAVSVRNGQIRVYPYQIPAPRCIGEDVTVSFGA